MQSSDSNIRVARFEWHPHLLFGHHLAGAVVHLGVVDADAAEDGERLEEAHVGLVELLITLLW